MKTLLLIAILGKDGILRVQHNLTTVFQSSSECTQVLNDKDVIGSYEEAFYPREIRMWCEEVK